MSYKLIKEHEDKYEMQHPNGNTFYVAKKGLNKKVTNHIKSLGVKGYADGGVVEPIDNPYNSAIPAPAPTPIVEPIENVQQQPMLDRQPAKQVQQPIVEPIENTYKPTQQAQEVTTDSTPQMSSPDMLAGYNQISQGLGSNAQAQSDLARRNAETYGQLQKDLKTAEEIHQKSRQAQVKELEAMQEQVSKDVDPNRYWGSMSTGNKIGASIGLILGGIGAGMAGGENQALKVINNAIENDIKSQMADKSNKMNLYRANLEKYKDDQDAYRQTRLEMMAMADLKLKQAESNAKSQEAKAALQVARGELQMKAAPLIEEAAKRKTQMEIIKMANTSPESISPAMVQFLPKEQQERYIPGAGFAAIVPTDKDREAIASSKSAQDDIKDLISMSKKGTTIPGSQQDLVNKNKIANLQLKMKNAFQLGVLSQTDYDMLNKLVADPGSIMTGRAVAQLQSTLNSMKNTEQSIYNKLGIQRQAQETAQPEIKTMNGIPYQKVTGGWKPIKTGR